MSSSGDKFIYLDSSNGSNGTVRMMYWLTDKWIESNYQGITYTQAPYYLNGISWTSIRFVLSRDGSFVGVYGYYLNINTGNFELMCMRYTWGNVDSSLIPISDAVTVASIVDRVTSYGIPAAMTADGQVQMVSSWDDADSTNGTFISYNGGSTWAPGELSVIKCYAIFFSPDGSYTTAFVVNPTGSVKAIKYAYTATPTVTNILNPFVTSDDTQWPTAYQPGGPATVQEALDLIARFMKASAGDTATFVAWNTFT
jgi:hypothetical protein